MAGGISAQNLDGRRSTEAAEMLIRCGGIVNHKPKLAWVQPGELARRPAQVRSGDLTNSLGGT